MLACVCRRLGRGSNFVPPEFKGFRVDIAGSLEGSLVPGIIS